MYEAGIITPIRFSDWVSNLVPTRKKIGENRLCVDLRNLNKVSLKDNYPLPKMDHTEGSGFLENFIARWVLQL